MSSACPYSGPSAQGSFINIASPTAEQGYPYSSAKIDRGDSIPAAYHASIARFFTNNSSTGSDPAVTADVIYRAVIDPDPTAVRYYSAPASASIRRGKRILGAAGYWQEFRNAVLGHPSDLRKTLMEAPGATPVEIEG
jgi:hypothetical protein